MPNVTAAKLVIATTQGKRGHALQTGQSHKVKRTYFRNFDLRPNSCCRALCPRHASPNIKSSGIIDSRLPQCFAEQVALSGAQVFRRAMVSGISVCSIEPVDELSQGTQNAKLFVNATGHCSN